MARKMSGATIEDIIQQSANPFDAVTFKTGNFWQEENHFSIATVESIHQQPIDQITQLLNQVAQDHQTRTVLLAGDPGSGKSYVLKRLKQHLNDRAFFAYIPPFVDNDHIWRHTLRQTVDSLMYKPEGQEESQLILWLKSLSVFKNPGLFQKLLGERTSFINHFKKTYSTSIYQAKDFFGILYALTQPDLYFNACNWLRGDDLDEEDLQSLKVKTSIDSEAAAQGILANLGKISTSTYPIVLCFDQIESKLLPDGSADIQPVFHINTVFHNEGFKNFLMIISIVTNTWRQNSHRIQQSDRDRIEQTTILKPITLDQAEALWESRLRPLHALAYPPPTSHIYPLNRNFLEQRFAGGKTTPRSALTLGEQLFRTHKFLGKAVVTGPAAVEVPKPNPPATPPPPAVNIAPPPLVRSITSTPIAASSSVPTSSVDAIAVFKLLWERELKKTEQKVTRIGQFSAPELISMLCRSLTALQVQAIQPKLLTSPTYSSYSCQFQALKRKQKVGLVWAENSNMTSFFHIMEACRKIEEKAICQALYLIRAERTGKTSSKGYQLYQQIFLNSPQNQHLKPELESVHYLATYDRLVNSTHAQELVIAGRAIQMDELEAYIRESQVLQHCRLLQELGIIPTPRSQPIQTLEREKDFFLNFVKTHQVIARKVVIHNTASQFPKLTDAQIQQLIEDLCQENQICILDAAAAIEEQILCLVPQK